MSDNTFTTESKKTDFSLEDYKKSIEQLNGFLRNPFLPLKAIIITSLVEPNQIKQYDISLDGVYFLIGK